MPRTDEEIWHDYAIKARECLRLLGYPRPLCNCLPGEPDAVNCGIPASLHLVAYFAALRGMVDHFLSQVDHPELKQLIDACQADAVVALAAKSGPP